jgi:acyl-CoA reductase-like NAD-dependent aldehyde dehydrogenase
VAIVDRTADLNHAARELIYAKTIFGGAGPYAPSYIVVNEFAEKELVDCMKEHLKATMSCTNRTQSDALLEGRGIKLVKAEPK